MWSNAPIGGYSRRDYLNYFVIYYVTVDKQLRKAETSVKYASATTSV
jgi:hypothetical protein